MTKKPGRAGKKRQPASIKEKISYVGVLVVGGLLMLAIFCAIITPQRYHLEVGDIAFQSITASRDVVDIVTTQQLREEAAVAVEPSYLFKDGVTDAVAEEVAGLFAQMRDVQEYAKGIAALDESTPSAIRFSADQIAEARTRLTGLSLYDYQMQTLLRSTPEALNDLETTLTAAVKNTMSSTVREGHESEAISSVLQVVGYKTETSLLQNVASPLLRTALHANMVIDEETTALARQRASEAVEPVIYKQGQNIVLSGEQVNANQLEMLRSLGLLDDDSADLTIYVGAFMIVLAVLVTLGFLLRIFAGDALNCFRKYTVMAVTMVITMGACAALIPVNVYLAPIQLTAMMMVVLLGSRVSFLSNIAIVLMVSAMATGSTSASNTDVVCFMLANLLSGAVTCLMLRRKPQRLRVLICGACAAAVHLFVMLAAGLLTNTDINRVFSNALWSMLGAMISAVCTLGLEPVMESLFSIPTASKLLELSNPNQPLMRRLLLEAPGTYHHSIIVANLAEAAAEAINANPLLARAGAYYHDIGKLKRPLYFKENQMGENPHDHTDPYVSAAIVTSHTLDGVALAQQHHLPEEIQQIIAQHHGDTPTMFFYHKAVQLSEGKPVDVKRFRYEGERPTGKEAAIVMLADTVEAAVRSMKDPTPESIRENIEKLVRGKLEDGQMNHAPVSFRDIDRICNAFAEVLKGAFHERIEYPKVDLKEMTAEQEKPAEETETAENAGAAENVAEEKTE